MSGQAMSSSTVSGVTEPPYWMRTACATSAPYISARSQRMKWCTPWAMAGVAVRPVPMAQTGS